MFCIKCGSFCQEGDTFCSQCGTPIPAEQTAPKKKGRLWIPFVLILVFSIVGFSAFFMFRTIVDPEMPWYSIKNGTLSFYEGLYTGNRQLTVPDTVAGRPVTAIDAYCFRETSTLETITISEGVETIGDYAFYNSVGLKGVNLPDSVTEIGVGAFYDCSDLEAVRLSASVSYLDSDTFLGCTNLKYVYFRGTAQQWEETYNGSWPYEAKIYLVDGDSYEEYVPTT